MARTAQGLQIWDVEYLLAGDCTPTESQVHYCCYKVALFWFDTA